MLRWISIFGGLLIMMGHHERSEALFYYFRLEDQVPENHLLRLIDKHAWLQQASPKRLAQAIPNRLPTSPIRNR